MNMVNGAASKIIFLFLIIGMCVSSTNALSYEEFRDSVSCVFYALLRAWGPYTPILRLENEAGCPFNVLPRRYARSIPLPRHENSKREVTHTQKASSIVEKLLSMNVNDTSSESKDVRPRSIRHQRTLEDSDIARPISRILVEKNLTEFSELLKEAGLSESIDFMNRLTLFVPTNDALANPVTAAKLRELRADRKKLREVLLFHMAGMKLQKCDLGKDMKEKSKFCNKHIRINQYTKKPRVVTAECARILNFHEKACDGTVHEIDRLILPPTGSVYDIIQRNTNYSILREVLQDTKIEEELKKSSSITFLAPKNEAFTKLGFGQLNMLKDNKILADFVIRKHIFRGNLCCAGVGRDSTRLFPKEVKNLLGDIIKFSSHGDVISTERATVTDCDNMATNGIIHTVDGVMVYDWQIPVWNSHIIRENLNVLTENKESTGRL